jgi:hypothetical protein
VDIAALCVRLESVLEWRGRSSAAEQELERKGRVEQAVGKIKKTVAKAIDKATDSLR